MRSRSSVNETLPAGESLRAGTPPSELRFERILPPALARPHPSLALYHDADAHRKKTLSKFACAILRKRKTRADHMRVPTLWGDPSRVVSRAVRDLALPSL